MNPGGRHEQARDVAHKPLARDSQRSVDPSQVEVCERADQSHGVQFGVDLVGAFEPGADLLDWQGSLEVGIAPGMMREVARTYEQPSRLTPKNKRRLEVLCQMWSGHACEGCIRPAHHTQAAGSPAAARASLTSAWRSQSMIEPWRTIQYSPPIGRPVGLSRCSET